MAGYDHKDIEQKAQAKWASLNLYETDLRDETKDPYYLLCEFPYPSGDLHIGHWYAFAVTDIYARYLRMQGKNVLFPIGFDAFGLPAENAAMKHGADPAAWTLANIERMKSQLASMGASFDWSKEVVACDPSYYKWTQWLFTKLFENKLAEHREAAVKWCPKDQTVLANEQVKDGCCDRCGTPVEEKLLTQWFLKITQYADRLLKDLDALPWREEIKDAQRAWIGKSEGAKLSFPLDFKKHPEDNDRRGPNGERAQIEVFTTRADTLFGATYLVLAPDHLWVTLATDDMHDVLLNKEEVKTYVEQTRKKTERERSENKEKTGVELKGVMAINPATHEEIPIFIADYVLASYGTGAIMAVPAHDERDFEFAQKFSIPVVQVVAPPFIQTTEPGAFKHGEPLIARDGIIALIKHWKEDTYLALKWKEVAWGTFLTGSIDPGLTPEETVSKEIREETGYTDLKSVKSLGIVDGYFYHVPKQMNNLVHGHVFAVELGSDAREMIEAEEDAKHEVKWLTIDELKDFLTPATHQYALSVLRDGYVPYTGDGTLTNSGQFTGKNNRECAAEIVALAGGEMTTQYRLRDWLVSRQRYWGCPIPIVYDPEGKPHLVPAEHLPWMLPTDVDFTPTGSTTLTTGGPKSPLASSQELKNRVTKLFGEGWTPEYDTLDTFVDSSWYFTRYLDPTDANNFSDASLMKKWLPVHRYSGGAEHTTMHLLYSRFFTKALYDLALVPVSEPFAERFNRGIILGPDGQKMSKSKGNVINPDDMVSDYGADAVRVYLAFIGPYNEPGSYPWNLDGVASMRKFLDRVVRLAEKVEGHLVSTSDVDTRCPQSLGVQRALAKTAKKVGEDNDKFKFNTAIAALMTLLNQLEKEASVSAEAMRDFTVMLAPFAPHLAEYLYEKMTLPIQASHDPSTTPEAGSSVHQAAWPSYDATLLAEETVEVTVQVGGKRRGSVRLSAEATEAEALAEARTIPAVAAALAGAGPSRVVYVPGRILNLVV